MTRPTIAELEEILNSGKDIPVEILPNGEVTVKEGEILKCPSCGSKLILQCLNKKEN